MSVDDRGGPQPGERKRRRVTPGSVAAALFGAALFALTLRQTRLDEVVAGMQSVGWGFLVIILLSGLRLLVRAWAWTLCTPADAGLRVRDTFPAFLTGDALGNLTPLGLFASEATKAVYVRHRVPLGHGRVGPDDREPDLHDDRGGGHRQRHARAARELPRVEHGLEVVFLVSVGAMVAMLVAAAFIVGRQIKVMTGILDWLHRRSLAPHALAGRLEKLRTLEDTVYGFHRQESGAAGHGGRARGRLSRRRRCRGVRHPGLDRARRRRCSSPSSWRRANRLTNVVFKFVPMRLGVDEAGSALLTTVLGYTSATGATLALVRKVRMLVWTAVGVFFLARWRGADADA